MASDAQKGGGPGGNDPAKPLEPQQQNTDVQERLKAVECQMAEFKCSLEQLQLALAADIKALRQEVAKPRDGAGQEWLAGYSAEEQESLEKSRVQLECLQEGLRVRRAPA